MRNVSMLLLAALCLACGTSTAQADPTKPGAFTVGNTVGVHKFAPEHIVRLDRDFAREQLILNQYEDAATKEMKPYADDIEEVYKIYHLDPQLVRSGLVTVDLKAGTYTVNKPPAPAPAPPPAPPTNPAPTTAPQPSQHPSTEKKEKK